MAESSAPAKAAANGFLRCTHCGRKLPARVRHEAVQHLARTLGNVALVAHVVVMTLRCQDRLCGAIVEVKVGDLIPG